MNILVAVDSMKGSISSREANHIISSVGKEYGHQMHAVSVSDGGEGFLASFLDLNLDYQEYQATVPNLYGKSAEVPYLLSESKKVAVIESALIVGIQMVSQAKSWRETTSAGIGAMIKLIHKQHQPKQIIVGLGGTGTIDGGFGCLTEMGVQFFDEEDQKLSIFAGDLEKVRRVKLPDSLNLSDCDIIVANDVTNFLFGPEGATTIYGKQKGLSENDRQIVDTAIEKMYHLLMHQDSVHGDGAAGGLGFALRFLGGKSRSGFEIVAEEVNLAGLMSDCDLVITGEGRMDAQTLNGKLPQKINQLAQDHKLPCIAFVGAATEAYQSYRQSGFQAVYPLGKEPESLEDALNHVEENLKFAAYSLFGTLAINQIKD